MAEIVQDPQLRYTSDTQTPVAETIVQFDAVRDGDPPATLKVVAWRKLAEALSQNYHRGDRIVIEGRLSMILVDRPEGFKEKRAELTAQRIHTIAAGAAPRPAAAAQPQVQPQPTATPASSTPPIQPTSQPTSQPTTPPPSQPTPTSTPSSDDLLEDEIPF